MALPLVIGRGKLYVNNAAVGNCSQVRFAPKIEAVRYNDYSTGIRRTGKIRIAGKTVTGSFVTDYITADNLDLFLDGALLASVVFEGDNPTGGPDILYTFTNVAVFSEGETSLIGDEWQSLSFTFEGTLTEPSVSPIGGTWQGTSWDQQQSQWATTTTTTTSTSTTTT